MFQNKNFCRTLRAQVACSVNKLWHVDRFGSYLMPNVNLGIRTISSANKNSILRGFRFWEFRLRYLVSVIIFCFIFWDWFVPSNIFVPYPAFSFVLFYFFSFSLFHLFFISVTKKKRKRTIKLFKKGKSRKKKKKKKRI